MKYAVLIAAQIAIHLFASVMSAKLLIAQNAVNKHSVKVVLNGSVIAAELFEVARTVLMLPAPTVARYQKISMKCAASLVSVKVVINATLSENVVFVITATAKNVEMCFAVRVVVMIFALDAEK